MKMMMMLTRKADGFYQYLGACIFLGANVSEEPWRLKEIVNCVQMIRPECPEYTRIEQTTTNKEILLEHSKSKQLIPLWTRQPPLLNDAYSIGIPNRKSLRQSSTCSRGYDVSAVTRTRSPLSCCSLDRSLVHRAFSFLLPSTMAYIHDSTSQASLPEQSEELFINRS